MTVLCSAAAEYRFYGFIYYSDKVRLGMAENTCALCSGALPAF